MTSHRENLLKEMYKSVARMNDALTLPVQQAHEAHRCELVKQADLRQRLEEAPLCRGFAHQTPDKTVYEGK